MFCRTLFSASLSLQTRNGSCLAPRIGACSSGTRGPATLRSCSKDTRTPSSQSHQALWASTLPPDPEICAPVFGRTLEWALSKTYVGGARLRHRMSSFQRPFDATSGLSTVDTIVVGISHALHGRTECWYRRRTRARVIAEIGGVLE